MGAWICPTCRLHYGEEARQRCPADGAPLVLNLSGASVQGHLLTHLLHVKPDGTTVWEAHAGPDERVALELLRGPQDPLAWAWAKTLDHPHIVAVRGFAPIDDDLSCAVMDWIDGEPLSERLAQGPLPVATALGLVDQILDALAYVHQQDGVHGDLQPATIFVAKGTDAQLINVGVHRWPPLAEVLGRGGAPALDLPMVAYAAPERLAMGAADPAGDLYSLSALLWHLLTGAPIFGVDPHACARAHLTAPRPQLSAAFPDRAWPVGLESFLARGLARRPADRFASAEAMRGALRPIQEASQRAPEPAPVVTDRPVSVPPMMIEAPIERSPEPTRGIWFAGVGALLIGGVLIGNALRSDPPPDASTARAPKTTAAQPASVAVERVRAMPDTTAPAPASVARVEAAPASAALASNASVAPMSVESAGPMSVAVASTLTAAPQSIAPTTTAPMSAAPASVAVAPASAAPVLQIEPVEVRPVEVAKANPPAKVATEPASPASQAAVARAPVKVRAPSTAKAVARAERTPRRAKPRRVVRRRRKADRPKRVARTPERAQTPAPLPTLGEKPKLAPTVSKHGIRILGQ